jgi:hypothetical protein
LATQLRLSLDESEASVDPVPPTGLQLKFIVTNDNEPCEDSPLDEIDKIRSESHKINNLIRYDRD